MTRPASRPGSGPERIAAAFDRANAEGRAALIAFLAAGDPDYETTVELARAAVEAGADIIELGAPFSDPLADGPVIQAAYTRALAAGATTSATLACAREVATATGAPVVLMVALNCVLAYGLERFCEDAAAAGVSGLLVPDLPVDDAGELRAVGAASGLGIVFLAGPDSGPTRVAAAAAGSTGFVYLMRRRGITGAGSGGIDLARRVADARAVGSAPVAVGFGVATAADAAEVAGLADGVIVGSALVEAASQARSAAHTDDPVAGRNLATRVVGERVRALVPGLDRGQPSSDQQRPTAAGGRA